MKNTTNSTLDIANNAWLGLGDISQIQRKNQFAESSLETMGLNVVRLMSNPDYIGYTAKILLDIDLLPVQCAILRELWIRPFPMFVASRGFGKTIRDVFITTDSGFKLINNLFRDDDLYEQQIPIRDKLLGESGFRKPAYGWKKRPNKTLKITTRFGFELEGSFVHPLRTVDTNEVVWKELSKLSIGDKVVITRDDMWFPNTNNITPDEGYLFGCLIGDGGYTVRGRISYTTSDPEIVDMLNITTNRLWGKRFIKQKSKYQYLLYGVNIWDELFQKYGFNSPVCAEKDVPTSILSASKESVASFLSGVFDTDGHVSKTTLWVEYCSKSKNLVKAVQFLLTRFGIISRIKPRLNKKYNRTYYYLYIYGDDVKVFHKEIGFKLTSKQLRLENIVHINTNTNCDVLPRKLILDSLLKLHDLFYQDTHIGGHNYKYNRQLITPSKLKNYEISYITLKKIIDIFSRSDLCKSSEEYKFICDIYNSHYFYDSIVKIEEGYNELYDFYIPEDHSYLSGGFISHNSYCLALYALLKCALVPGTKVIICGAAYRQSKIIFDYAATIWSNAPILRSVCDSNSGPKISVDRCVLNVNDSWMIAIPIGTGEKIRGLRAHTIIADEYASISPDIYETVISGFAAVSSSPIDNVKDAAKREALIKAGIFSKDKRQYSGRTSNQAIISGTADYSFKHFADYWRRYVGIIRSKGDRKKLREVFGEDVPEDFDWRDYSVIRYPYELIPDGFMDSKVVARAKATGHSAMYKMEYGTVFVEDSDGFFKRSLLEACVASDSNVGKVGWPIWCPNTFDGMIRGNPKCQYVFGIDPASEQDNCTIVVLELHQEHCRVVYCWATNKKIFREKVSKGATKEQDFYSYVARKVRNLMKIFPCTRIGMDAQGGGIAIEEALHDTNNLLPGEVPIWPIIDEDKPTDMDNYSGAHMLELVQFANGEWTSTANHGLRKDLEDKMLLFPRFDPLTLEIALAYDQKMIKTGEDYDTLEDCVMEIEELKNELCTITMTRTGTGVNSRDRWDTPEIKLHTGKKGRLRKDRYSALVIANMIARTMNRVIPEVQYEMIGGRVMDMKKQDGQLYDGPEWFTLGMASMSNVMGLISRNN
jgi:intein/homing endonuclease